RRDDVAGRAEVRRSADARGAGGPARIAAVQHRGNGFGGIPASGVRGRRSARQFAAPRWGDGRGCRRGLAAAMSKENRERRTEGRIAALILSPAPRCSLSVLRSLFSVLWLFEAP